MTALSEPELAQLAKLIADQIVEKTIPIEIALWGSADLGRYFRCSPRNAIERYANHADFPPPIHLPSTGRGRGHPKWKAGDVVRWAQKFAGRPSSPSGAQPERTS